MLAGAVLAAGASSRMGRPKELLRIGRETFLSQILGRLRAVAPDRVVVTVARNTRKNLDNMKLGEFVVLENANSPADGQIGSIRTAISWVINRSVEAVLVWPVDYPAVAESTVRSLVAAFLRFRMPITAPAFRGLRGHPVIFSRCVFGELLDSRATEGARAVVRRDPARVLSVDVADSGVLEDIDTPDDYARLLAGLGPS